MAQKRSRWATEAAQSALLRYQPQLDALAELQRQAESTYKTGIAQARGNADATIATVAAATPAVSGIYDHAGLDQARTASIVNRDIAGLGLSPDLQAAVGLEQADAASRVSTGRAQALGGLQQQRVAARAGGQYAGNKAYDDLVAVLQKIGEQRTSLASESGTYQALTQNQLTDAATKRADTLASQSLSRGVTKRGQDLSHGDRVASLAQRAADKKAKAKTILPGGAQLRSPKDHGAFQDQVEALHAWIEAHKGDYKDRHEAAQDLSVGEPASTITDPKTGEKIKDPGVPKAKSQLALSVALDLSYDGAVSRHGFNGQGNLGRLHSRGYSIDRLGYRVQPRRRNPNSAAANAVADKTRKIF